MKDTIYNFSLLFTMLTVASEQALKQAKLATRERASKRRRRERQRKGKLSVLSTPPRTRVSLRVLLSRDFSRLLLMESLFTVADCTGWFYM